MALNFSYRPPVIRFEENFVHGRSHERDICELLPVDPFEMGIAAFTGLLEDCADVGKGDFQHTIMSGWPNWVETFQNFPGHINKLDDRTMIDTTQVTDRLSSEDEFWLPEDKGFDCTSNVANCGTTGNVCCDGIDSYRKNNVNDNFLPDDAMFDLSVHLASHTLEGSYSGTRCDSSFQGINSGDPCPALSFALAHLGVRDLLSVERVCRSLRYTVQNDPLLWRSIHIDQQLSGKITDDDLVRLTDRSKGILHSLSLVNCHKITDDGLRRVLERNLMLTKLNVQGSMKLTIDGIVDCLKSYKLVAVTGIKHLRVHAILGVTQKHFEELKSLLGIDDNLQNNHMPCFLLQGSPHLSNEDDRPIDIDMCPRCQNPRLVYDCPVKDCQGKDHTTQVCRACTLCIARCVQCGKCLNDEKYEETFFLEKVCSDCWNQALLCQVSEDVGNTTSMHG